MVLSSRLVRNIPCHLEPLSLFIYSVSHFLSSRKLESDKDCKWYSNISFGYYADQLGATQPVFRTQVVSTLAYWWYIELKNWKLIIGSFSRRFQETARLDCMVVLLHHENCTFVNDKSEKDRAWPYSQKKKTLILSNHSHKTDRTYSHQPHTPIYTYLRNHRFGSSDSNCFLRR